MPTFFINSDSFKASNAFVATLGAAPGSTYLGQCLAAGLPAAANAMLSAMSATTATTRGDAIAANLGLTGTAATTASNYLATVAFAGAASTHGAGLLAALDLFTTLQSDATFGAAATAYVARVNNALSYSSVAANNSTDLTTLAAAIGSAGSTGAGSTFTLTAGTDLVGTTSATSSGIASSFRLAAGNQTMDSGAGTLNAADVFLDPSTTDTDSLNATLTGNSGAFTSQNIERLNFTAAAGTVVADLTNVAGATQVNTNGTVAARIDGFNAAASARPEFGISSYTNTLTLRPTTLAGTTAAATAETIGVTVSGTSFGTTAATRSALVIDGNAGAGTLETLNITSSGTAANDFALSTANAGVLGTVNVLGSAGATLRVSHADITGVTVAAGSNTGDVLVRIDRNGATTTPTNVANFSGVDKIQVADGTAGGDDLSLSAATTGQVIEALATFSAATITVSGSAARTTDSLTVIMDNATAATSVALGNLDAQDVETMNLVSSGNSAALVAAGNTATLLGDATTVTITGDTSLNLTVNVDAPATGSRTTVINASGMTGTATATINASGDTSTTNLYTITGTANGDTLNGTAVAVNIISGGDGNDTITGGVGNDTIDGGNGNDNYTTSGGVDTLTGGAGNDTLILSTAVAGTVAVQEVQTITWAAQAVSTVAAGYTLRILGEDISSATFNADATPTINEFEANITAAINASAGALAGRFSAVDGAGVVVTFAATEGDVAAITVRGFGTPSTSGAATASAASNGTVTVAQTSTGVLADVVDVTWSDFVGGSTDFIGRGNLTLAAGGYYEGSIAAATQATEYAIMVITDQSYASITAIEADINTRLTDNSDDDMIVVFLNSSLGHAEVFYDSDIDTNGVDTTNSIVLLTGITTLSGLAGAFADTGATFTS